MSIIDRHIISEQISLAYDGVQYKERVIWEFIRPDEDEHFPYTKVINQIVDIKTDEVLKEYFYYSYKPIEDEIRCYSDSITLGSIKIGNDVSDFISIDEMRL